jgi:predicted nucleotidyltransferase component of viral defense system
MPEWSFGGGTALMLQYQHRNSHDIDIFLPDPQWIGILHPERNDTVEGMISDYAMGPTWLKLVIDEPEARGEIDFIVAPPLTMHPFMSQTIRGIRVLVETPVEIVAKKLRYRGGVLRSRDLFDIAVVSRAEPVALWANRTAWQPMVNTIAARLEQLKTRYRLDAPHLDVLPAGEPFREAAWSIVHQVIDRQLHEASRGFESER